jgi:hypothetical protein
MSDELDKLARSGDLQRGAQMVPAKGAGQQGSGQQGGSNPGPPPNQGSGGQKK